MCTLAVAFRARADTPLAVTANRDELYARPALPPRVEGGVLAPVDAQAGGTWLGLNRRGLFAGITNRAGGPRDASRRSRGSLVAEALQAQSARELHARLASTQAITYNGFHLLYADGEAAFVTWSDGEKVTQLELPPGVHVVTERSFNAGVNDRAPAVQQSLRELLARGPPSAEAMRELMKAHGPPDAPLEGTCVHGEAFGYGTRSSFQLVVGAGGEQRGLWTEGHPCTEAARDLAPLLGQLI
jgi:uncharacterized protein with NRDE domain